MATEESACCALPVKKKKAGAAQNQVSVSGVYSNYNLTGNRLIHTNSEQEIPSDTFFNTPFGDGDDELPVEKGRYRLIWTPLCPWATRLKITKDLLGIGEDVISTGKVNPVKSDSEGWIFSLAPGERDPVLGIHLLSEAYEKTAPDGMWNATVPAIVDVTTGEVVNNDYHTLPNQFETSWKSFHSPDAPDLYPKELRPEIDELNQIIFHDVNNGVYKAGFARSQAAYSEAYNLVFDAFDKLEDRLSKQRFLFGDYITESDVRLYVTLARFDIAYFNGFRVNKRMLRDYPNLWGYARDLYAVHAFGANTHFDAIKRHYHLFCLTTNPYNILPVGPDEALWNVPANREHLSHDPEHKFRIEAQ